MKRLSLLLMATAALSACNLEPKYSRADPPVPPSWPVGDAYLKASEATLPSISYRDIFRDPKLQALVEQGIANNRDFRIAAANIEAARAQYKVQRASLLPQIDGSARATISKSGTGNSGVSTIGTGTGTGTGDTGTGAGTGGTGTVVTTSGGGVNRQYNLNLGLASFEIDLFGRLRSLSNAALQEYFATEAAARTARLSLVGELASAYLTLAADRSLLRVARDTAKSAQRSVELTAQRLRGGIAPRTDLRQAETVLAQAQADEADQITQVAQDRNAIELLVGAPVADANLPESIESVDGLVGELPAGLDSRILLRRPDVIDAEYRLRAANARIGAARAAFFPTISLTAAAGLASRALTSLFTGGAFAWSIAPAATLPIFDGGANRGNLAYAKAQRDLTLAQYEQAIQTAFREVADALARRGTIDAQFAAQSRLEFAARDNYTLANARYRGGIDPFLNTLDAQRTLYTAQRALITARLTRASNRVTLYRTLGGDALTDAR